MKKFFYTALFFGIISPAQLLAQQDSTHEIVHEVNIAKGSVIRIVTVNRTLRINTWDQPMARLVMQAPGVAAPKGNTTEEQLENLGISLKPFSNRLDIVAIRTAASSGSILYATPHKTAATASKQATARRKVLGQPSRTQSVRVVEGKSISDMSVSKEKVVTGRPAAGTQPFEVVVKGKPSTKKLFLEEVTTGFQSGSRSALPPLEISIPAGCRLDIENKHGDVIIYGNLEQAELDISYGALDMADVQELELVGKYCNANLGNIEKAQVDFQNGSFRALTINDLDIDSRSSTIEYEKGDYVYMRSQSDHFTIDEIDKLDGRKMYGSVRIDILSGNFDMEGNNVDIKIRTIEPTVELIRINNKYGDVRLPVKNLANYYVDFTGYYSTVFTPFTKNIVKEEKGKIKAGNVPTDEEETEKVMAGIYFQKSAALAGEMAPRRFTGTVGDINVKHTRFNLTCHSCTVDFK